MRVAAEAYMQCRGFVCKHTPNTEVSNMYQLQVTEALVRSTAERAHDTQPQCWSQEHASTLDGIIDTVSAKHPLPDYLNLLKLNGRLAIVGVPPEPLELPSGSLVFQRRLIGGSLIGGIRETQEMLVRVPARMCRRWKAQLLPASDMRSRYAFVVGHMLLVWAVHSTKCETFDLLSHSSASCAAPQDPKPAWPNQVSPNCYWDQTLVMLMSRPC